MTKYFFSLLFLSLIAKDVLAQPFQGDGKQFYGAIGLSRISIDTDFEVSFDSLDFSESDTAYNIRAGYMFTNWFGIEAGYYDFGNFEDSINSIAEDLDIVTDFDVNVDIKGYSLSIVGAIPLKIVDLYAKVGAIRLDGEASASALGFSISRDETSTEPFVSVGAELNLGKVDLFAEYTRIADTDIAEVSLLTLGAKLSF